MKFSVFMEQVNEALSLDRNATVEQFAARVNDLVTASSVIATK